MSNYCSATTESRKGNKAQRKANPILKQLQIMKGAELSLTDPTLLLMLPEAEDYLTSLSSETLPYVIKLDKVYSHLSSTTEAHLCYVTLPMRDS